MINVAYCLDRNYQQHFGASIMSLLLNFRGPAETLRIFVITDEADQNFRERIDLLGSLFKASIDLYLLDKDDLKTIARLPLPRASHLSRASYFRLLLPSVLPAEIDRVLYLDSDTIVLDGVQELFAVALSGKPVAGVPDFMVNENSARLEVENYINTGVLLLDLSVWRRERLAAQCFEWLTTHPEKAKHQDQCAINAVNNGRIALLEGRWNSYVVSWAKMENAGSMPGILHYIHIDKPWHAWYGNDWGRYYWRYLDVSPWKGVQAVQPGNITQAHKMARELSRQGKTGEAILTYEKILGAIDRAQRSAPPPR